MKPDFYVLNYFGNWVPMNWTERPDGSAVPALLFLKRHMLFGVIVYKHWVVDRSYDHPAMLASKAGQLTPEERLDWYVRALDHYYFTLKRAGELASPDDLIIN